MIEIVSKFLEKYNIKNKSAIVGFSSGPDSCALALILSKIKDKFNLDLTLAYFNHGWRKEAQNEEEFTKEFASKIGAKYTIGHIQEGLSQSETAAREQRYDFFKKTAEENNSNVVFLAHNKDDNIETLIYRVIKGTSPKGLSAIPEKRDIYYRPLLSVSKDEILQFLKVCKQNYCIDKSNSDTKYKRNYIRHNIIPEFEKVNPNYKNAIPNLIRTSIAQNKIIDDAIAKIEEEIFEEGKILREKYLALGEEYRYEILNRFIGSKLKNRDYKTIKKLDDFILENKSSKTSLNRAEFLRTRRNRVFIEANEDKNEG